MKLRNIILAAMAIVALSSCKSQYEMLLTSNDADLKYEAAFDYFNEGKYSKAGSLFESLSVLTYGIGCGVLTIVIRYFGGYNEGVSYAILIMNCCVVLLDRIGRPTKYGAPPKQKKEAAK